MDIVKTAFITGATGYIGRNVARAFRRAGYRVLGLTRDASKAASLAADEIVPVIGRLQDPAAWRAAAGSAEVLVHTAVDYSTDTMALDQATVNVLAADAYVRPAERGSAGSAYIIADHSRATLREPATAARTAAGLRGEPRWLPHAEARKTMGAFADALALDQQFSGARAERVLGWTPRHPSFVSDAAIYAAANRPSQP